MKVVFTTEALADLDDILDYIAIITPLFPGHSEAGLTPFLHVLDGGRKAHRKCPFDRAYASLR